MEEGQIHVSPDRLKPLLYESRTFRPADDFSLTKEDTEIAFRELHETEHARTSALRELKHKIHCDQNLRYRTDDNFLLRFLRYSKFDVDKAYSTMHKFYNFRKNNPQAFLLSKVEQVLNTHFFTYLPYRDEDNCIFFWIDFRKLNLDEGTAWDMMSVYHVVAELLASNPNVQIHGLKGLYDLRGFTLKTCTQIVTPTLLLTLVKMLQDSYPWKIKKIVAVHSNYALTAIYNAVRYVLKKKIRDRMVFLGSDISELHQHLDIAIMPKEYGGTLEENDCYITSHVMENMNYIKYDRSFGLV